MKRALVSLSVFVLLAGMQGTSSAGLTATIVNSADSSSLVALNGAGSFDVTVQLHANEPVTALQMRLQEITQGNSPSGAFTLNSVTFATPIWSANGSGMEFNPAPQSLTAANSYGTDPIGDLPTDENTGTATDFDFATLNITLSNSAQGDYYLNLVDIVYGDSDFNDQVGTAGDALHVQVVPAPGAVVLGMIGLGMVGWARRCTTRREGCDRAPGSPASEQEI